MAASRVNTRFVVILVSVLVAIAIGGAGTVYFFVTNNSKRLVTLGDKAMEEGDIVKAERLYSKAVNKEQTNAEYIKKWIAAMEKLTPETENTFKSKYQEFFAANMALANRAMQRDVEAHRHALGMIHRDIKDRPNDQSGNSDMMASVDRALGFFESASDKKADVLRKYSGLALLRGYEAAANLKDSEIERARTDLEKAIAADPSDGEAVTGLARWHDRTAFTKATKQDLDGAKVEQDLARKILADFTAAYPMDPYGLLADVVVFVSDQENTLRQMTDAAARDAAASKAQVDVNARLDKLAASLGNIPPEKIDSSMIDKLASLELRFSTTGPSRSLALIEKFLTTRPADTRLLLAQAGLYGETKKEKEALAALDKLVQVPQQPVGYEGIMQFFYRARARYLQTIYTVRQWEIEKDPVAKKALLTAAQNYRAKLAEVSENDSPELLFVDANLNVANEQYGQGLKQLMEYNRKTNNNDTQALWMTSECAIKVFQDGTAETALRELIRRSPNEKRAIVRLADLLLTRLRREQEALDLFRRALLIDPNDADIKRVVKLIEARAAGEASGGDLDPIAKTLIQIEKLERDGKAAEALTILEKAYADTQDLRLLPALCQRLKLKGRRDEAIKLLNDARAKNPTNIMVQQALAITTTDDPMEQQLQLTDLANAPEIDKLVRKSQIYAVFGKRDKSDEMLDKATAIDANNASVIELLFVRALEKKDMTAAEKLAERARNEDLDLIKGASFRARVLDAQGRLGDAVRELETVQASPAFSPNAGRMLAEMLSRQRRLSDAVTVLTNGLRKSNTDRDSLYALGMLLVQLDRGEEALVELKQRQELHPADTQIQNLYLDLEAQYGDRELAKTRRRRNLDLRPDSVPDQLALAQLLVDGREFDEARQRIDNLKKSPEGRERVVPVEAQFYSNQGNMIGAKKVFDDFIASVEPSKVTPDMILAKARFMEGVGQINEAVAAYKDASKIQGPTFDADKALADLYTRQGDLIEARALLEKIVDGNGDAPNKAYAKRLVDVLLRLGKGEEAAKRLAALGSMVNEDSQMMIQQAEAVRLAGDEKKAIEIIDQAATKFPTDPYVYYRRAMMNVKFLELRADVLRDLGKAVELRPAFWQARRDRARIFVQEGKFEDAIKDMRDAVKFNPRIDELRVQLVRDLLKDSRDVEANEVIETVLKQRPKDVGVLLNSGDLFREGGRNDQALSYYRRAFEINKQLAVVTSYLDLLHAMPQPDLNEVDRVLLSVKDLIDKEPALLMSRAKQFLMRNKKDDAIRDIVSAARLLKADQPYRIMAWGSDIKRVLADARSVNLVMETVDKEHLIPGWTDYFRAGTMLEKEETRDQARDLLENMVKSSDQNPALLRQAYILLHAYYYQKNDCDNSLRTLNASVEKFADDAFILNNLAYTMLQCGKDPATIVPIAERAIQSMINTGRSTADLWDTMGIVYVKAKLLDKALQPLQAALAEAGNSYIRATVLLHITEYFIAKGDRAKAQEALAEARKIIEANPKAAEIAKHPEQLKQVQDLFDKMPK